MLFYSKCSGFTVCLTHSDMSLSMYINECQINVEISYLWFIVVLLSQKRFFERFWRSLSSPLTVLLGRPRRPRRQLQKTINLMIKTTALHVHHAFGTFFWRPLHDYDVKPPNLTFYGGRAHTTTNFPSPFWTWIKSLTIQLQEKSPAFDILSGSK